MSKLISTSKSNPCPICDNTTGKCRQGREDQDYWQCMSSADVAKGSILNGYKCLGVTKDRAWGQFKPTDGNPNKQEAEQRRSYRELAKRKEREELAKGALPIEDRDRAIRRLHTHFGLSQRHREDLQRRGLSDSQIDHRLYFTINPNQEVPFGIAANLPGVRDGQIKAAGPGYACVTFDSENRATGWQIRLDDATDNKYRWAKGERSSHLCNAELPITSAYPVEETKHSAIWACEGISKPAIAANRLGIVALGAASANFTASPQQSEEHLKKAAEFLKTQEIIFAPDGGAVSNPNVLSAYKRSWELFNKLGYQVKVAWWGQITKDKPDVDELDSLEGIEFITPKHFWDIVNHTRQQAERDEKLRQERLKLEAEDAIYEKLTTIQEKPWKVVNQDKINLEELLTEPGAIYIISSAKGTHKTNALKPVLAKEERVLAWFNRIALGREECKRIGLIWKDNASSYSNKNKRGFCADSAFQFDPKVLSNKGFLLGDECDQVFAHMFGSTCNKDGKRPLILATLEAHIDAAIHGGGIALFMSADVTQREIDYLKALAPEGCPVRLIVNEYEPPRGRVLFDISDNPDGKIEELLMALEAGIPCFLIDDIKNGVRGCKSIAEYVRTVHPEWASKIVEVNSDTSGDPLIIDYLENINQASKETLLLACSPSVVSGLSIENGHFGGVFALLNGILTVSDASQAIARVRGAEEINLWAAEEGLAYEANGSTDPDEIKDWYRRNYEANCKHLLSFRAEYEPITGEWGSPHFDLFCKNAAYRNLCMKRLRERLQTRLIDEGYDLIIQEDAGSDMVKDALKDCWHKIELTEAYAIANANILSDRELEDLQFKTTPLTPEEKLDLQKTLLLKWFGQELIDATTYEHDTGKILTGYAAMALKNERGVYRQQLENFYLLASDEGEAISKDIAAETSQLKHNQGRFPGDIRWRSRQRKARAWLGLPQFLNPEKWHEPNDYRAMGQKAKSKAAMIKDCLNLTVDNISDGQIFGELMCQLGLELDKEWATVKSGQRRFKRRRIAAESWKFAQMYVTYQEQVKAEREAEREASTSTQLSHDEVCQSDHPPQNIYTDAFFRGGVITEESQIEQAEQVEMLTQQLDGAISINTQIHDEVVCDSQCANLITPPSIYSETSFLGGGDQDLSQGAGEPLADVPAMPVETPSPIADLAEAFPCCADLETFAAVIEWYDDEVIAEAIAQQPDQPRRQQLWLWWEELAQSESTAVEKLAQVEPVQSESLRDRLTKSLNIPNFRQITEGLPVEEVKAAIRQLPERDRDRVLHYWKCCQQRGVYMNRLHEVDSPIANPASIRVGTVVEFTNPDRLDQSKVFEGIRMKIKKIFEGLSLAFCEMPDGSEQSFGIRTLVPVA